MKNNDRYGRYSQQNEYSSMQSSTQQDEESDGGYVDHLNKSKGRPQSFQLNSAVQSQVNEENLEYIQSFKFEIEKELEAFNKERMKFSTKVFEFMNQNKNLKKQLERERKSQKQLSLNDPMIILNNRDQSDKMEKQIKDLTEELKQVKIKIIKFLSTKLIKQSHQNSHDQKLKEQYDQKFLKSLQTQNDGLQNDLKNFISEKSNFQLIITGQDKNQTAKKNYSDDEDEEQKFNGYQNSQQQTQQQQIFNQRDLAHEAELMQRKEIAQEKKQSLQMLTSIAQDLQELNIDINTKLKEDQKKIDQIDNDAEDANLNMKDANSELQKKKQKMIKNFSRMACVIVFLVIVISLIPYI